MGILAAAITGVEVMDWVPKGCGRDALGVMAINGCAGVATEAGVGTETGPGAAMTGAIRRARFGAG